MPPALSSLSYAARCKRGMIWPNSPFLVLPLLLLLLCHGRLLRLVRGPSVGAWTLPPPGWQTNTVNRRAQISTHLRMNQQRFTCLCDSLGRFRTGAVEDHWKAHTCTSLPFQPPRRRYLAGNGPKTRYRLCRVVWLHPRPSWAVSKPASHPQRYAVGHPQVRNGQQQGKYA